jgi:hypothetical protein
MYNIAIAFYRLLFPRRTMVEICEISAKIEYNLMLGFAVKSNFKSINPIILKGGLSLAIKLGAIQ